MYDILYSIIGSDQKNFASELIKAQKKGKGLMYNEFQDLLRNTPNTQTTWDTYMGWVKEKHRDKARRHVPDYRGKVRF